MSFHLYITLNHILGIQTLYVTAIKIAILFLYLLIFMVTRYMRFKSITAVNDKKKIEVYSGRSFEKMQFSEFGETIIYDGVSSNFAINKKRVMEFCW